MLDKQMCFVECAFTNMGALKENDVIDPEPLYTYYARFDSSYREVVVKAISSCANIQDVIRQDVKDMGTSCSAFALVFHLCVAQLTLKNCPADRWKSSLLCNKLRAGVPSC
uniref:Uncharacterized protein n=1 Tax=Anopheles farauti TaxID=69004 RepID=A0A182QCU4_9DIPT